MINGSPTDDEEANPVSDFEASKTMGQIAFEAYWTKKYWMRRNQETIWGWDRQKPDEKEAWEECASTLLMSVTEEIKSIIMAMNNVK